MFKIPGIPNLRRGSLLGGIGVTGLWFAASRGIQLASGLWITRQLLPDDFALLATVFAIQGFAQQLVGINLSSHLVRAQTIHGDDLAVAWSYEFARNIVLFLLVFGIAPFIAEWMQRPDATSPLRWSATGLLIGSFRNPRLVELRREGKFGLLAALDSIPGIFYALFAIILVSNRGDYWSLIWAGLGSAVITVLASYYRLPWRPNFNFSWHRARPMFAFGVVILAATGLSAFNEHGMVFLISKSKHADELGYYNRGVAFSFALALQGVSVFWRVAYPHYSKIHIAGGDTLGMARRAQNYLLIAGLPLAMLGIWIGGYAIPLVLGEKWIPIIPLWSVFVLTGVFAMAKAPFEAAFQAIGKERMVLVLLVITTLLQLSFSWLMLHKVGIVGTAYGAIVASICTTFLYRLAAARKLPGFRIASP
jgi:O-antigen/teichoic acid export membrane protein